MARSDGKRPCNRLQDYGNDNVRPYREPRAQRATSLFDRRIAAQDRRFHRIRALALRPYGSADVAQGQVTLRPQFS